MKFLWICNPDVEMMLTLNVLLLVRCVYTLGCYEFYMSSYRINYQCVRIFCYVVLHKRRTLPVLT